MHWGLDNYISDLPDSDGHRGQDKGRSEPDAQ
jgi:hypothetical protein